MRVIRTMGQVVAGVVLLGVLAGCSGEQGNGAAAPHGAAAAASVAPGDTRLRSALPDLAQAAGKAQPQLPTVDFPPRVQDLAPGAVVLATALVKVEVTRVAYTPYGLELDATAEQAAPVTGGVVYLNYGDKGVIRDDRGGVYRLREDGHMLTLRMGGQKQRWKLHLLARGFVPPQARRMTLGLVFNSLDSQPTLVEAGWDIPPDLAARGRVAATDRVEPGRGWTFGYPPRGSNPNGTLAVRVYAVHWLRDGIALDLEALNGARDGRVSLNPTNWSLALRDDKGRRYPVVRQDKGAFAMTMEADRRLLGRVLFKPQVAPDARHLTLLAGGGADHYKDRDCAGDGVTSCGFDLDLGPIPPSAMPDLPAPAKADFSPISMVQRELPRVYPMAVSRIDRIALLKQALHATDEVRGTRVDLPGDVLFDFDRASLREDARPTLDRLAELIRRLDRPAHVTGYTDNKGGQAYNLRLSRERAQGVRDALLARGVPATLVQDVQGRGENDPVAPNTRPDGGDDPAGRQRNRRVTVLIEGARD